MRCSSRVSRPRGTAAPRMKAPKTEWTPAQSVNQAPSISSSRMAPNADWVTSPAASASCQPPQIGAQRPEHERRVAEGAAEGDDRDHRVVLEAGDDDGEDQPRGDIVHGAGGQRHRPDRRAGQAALVDDPRHHREGGDGQRRAEEQAGLRRGHRLAEEAAGLVQQHARADAERERREDSGERHGRRLPQRPLEQRRLELEADGEHVGVRAICASP